MNPINSSLQTSLLEQQVSSNSDVIGGLNSAILPVENDQPTQQCADDDMTTN